MSAEDGAWSWRNEEVKV